MGNWQKKFLLFRWKQNHDIPIMIMMNRWTNGQLKNFDKRPCLVTRSYWILKVGAIIWPKRRLETFCMKISPIWILFPILLVCFCVSVWTNTKFWTESNTQILFARTNWSNRILNNTDPIIQIIQIKVYIFRRLKWGQIALIWLKILRVW